MVNSQKSLYLVDYKKVNFFQKLIKESINTVKTKKEKRLFYINKICYQITINLLIINKS